MGVPPTPAPFRRPGGWPPSMLPPSLNGPQVSTAGRLVARPARPSCLHRRHLVLAVDVVVHLLLRELVGLLAQVALDLRGRGGGGGGGGAGAQVGNWGPGGTVCVSAGAGVGIHSIAVDRQWVRQPGSSLPHSDGEATGLRMASNEMRAALLPAAAANPCGAFCPRTTGGTLRLRSWQESVDTTASGYCGYYNRGTWLPRRGAALLAQDMGGREVVATACSLRWFGRCVEVAQGAADGASLDTGIRTCDAKRCGRVVAVHSVLRMILARKHTVQLHFERYWVPPLNPS